MHTGVSLQNLIQAASLCYAYPTLHSLKVRHSRRSATSSVFALGSQGFNLTSPSPFLLSNLSTPEMIASPYVVVQANRVRLFSNLMSGAYVSNVWWPSKKAGSYSDRRETAREVKAHQDF